MDELERRLRAVNEAPAKDRQALFNQIILKEVEKAYSSASIEALKILIHYGLSETLGLLTSRQIYSDFNQAFTQKNFPPEACINVFQYALGLLEQRTVAFEEQITLTRTALANIYEEQQEWLLAAKALSLIPLDSGTRQIAKEYKLSVFIRILRLYLEDEDYVSADQYINRAQMLDPQDKLSILQLLAAQAKSLDLKRQFLNSAVKYYELSICRDIHEDEQLEALRSSCICAILSGAGPQRSKILNTLYKDSRVSENELTLKDNVGFIVTRMHLGWVCRPENVKEFKAILKPHQLATLGDGSTVFDRAIMEHNIMAVSSVYDNITFNGLGVLLSCDDEKAEAYVSKMITENRLVGKIDQVGKLIYFSNSNGFKKWDQHIEGLCNDLEDVVTTVVTKYPGLGVDF